MDLQIKQASKNMLSGLVNICIESFHSDVLVGATEVGGPPGYNSLKSHKDILKTAKNYFAIYAQDTAVSESSSYKSELIGGAAVFSQKPGHYYLGTIYLRPSRDRSATTKVPEGMYAVCIHMGSYENLQRDGGPAAYTKKPADSLLRLPAHVYS